MMSGDLYRTGMANIQQDLDFLEAAKTFAEVGPSALLPHGGVGC